MMSRKGNVPILLLFVVALVLVITTLTTFVSFSKDFSVPTEQVSEILGEVDFSQQYVITSAALMGNQAIIQGGDIMAEFKDLSASRDLQVDSFGNFFGKIRNNEFRFEREDKGYVLEVKGLIVQSKRDVGSMVRHFDILLRFDGEGKPIS